MRSQSKYTNKMGLIPEMPLPGAEKMIPLLGFGTAAYPLAASEDMKKAISNAIKVGYRHFDTASLYNSEESLGQAMAEAISLGLIKSRDELFITSKLWVSDAHPGLVIPALKNTLKRLGVDYIDLYLIHFPVSLRPGGYEFPVKDEDLMILELEPVWDDMEECKKLGLTKSIGVSNFSCKKLEALLATASIPPAVNQVEMNPLWQQKKMREFCQEKGIHVTAYSPLGAKGTPWGSNWVMDCEVLQEIAKAKGRTTAQTCLRWVYEQGVSVLVKSFIKERMEENLDILDWELSPQELEKISQIPQRKGCFLTLKMASDQALWEEDFA